jgi:hypothetical protein
MPTLTVEISEDQARALRQKAVEKGLDESSYVRQLLDELLGTQQECRRPLNTGYGSLAQYGPGPTLEEFQEIRREMWAGVDKKRF